MKKIFLSLLTLGLLACSQNEEVNMANSETKTIANKTSYEISVVSKKSFSTAEENLKQKWKNLADGTFVKDKKHLSKEQLQKEMALYILDDCKAILLENGYSQNDFSNKFQNNYEPIILEAMKFYSNSIKN